MPCGVVLGMQGIDGDDPSGQGEPGGQSANGGDLVALVGDRLLSEDESAAVLGGGDEEVLPVGVLPCGAAHGLPVDGHGLLAGASLGGPSAHRAVEHVGVERGEDVVEGGDGGGGEAPQAMAVVGAKGAQLLAWNKTLTH